MAFGKVSTDPKPLLSPDAPQAGCTRSHSARQGTQRRSSAYVTVALQARLDPGTSGSDTGNPSSQAV
jgi:hypothetical protein